MAIYQKIKMLPGFEKLPLKGSFIFSVVTSTVTIIFGLLSNIILPPVIPLFYGLPQTNAQLANGFAIVIPATISIVFTLLNAVISINSNSMYVKKVLAVSTILICILATITTFKIIFLVGSI